MPSLYAPNKVSTSIPSTAASLQTAKSTCSPGKERHLPGGHEHRKFQALLPLGSLVAAPLPHSNLRCSASSAGLCQGASTGLFPNVRSHWHPGFTRKHLLALRAAPFLEGTSCYPKPPNPQGAAAFLLPICSLLSGKKNTNQGPVPLGVALLTDCKIPRHLGFAPILPVQRTRETFALTPLTRLRKFTAPGVGFLCCFLTVCSFNPLLLGPHSPSSP